MSSSHHRPDSVPRQRHDGCRVAIRFTQGSSEFAFDYRDLGRSRGQLYSAAKDDPAAPPLRCAECGREADHKARGWRALHRKEDPADEPEAFVFCPACWEREFGPEQEG
jgi:hypothetical protein